MVMARGRKGGQRYGASTALTLTNGAITSKEGKAKVRKEGADVWKKGNERVKEGVRSSSVEQTEVWNKRGFVMTSETGPRTGEPREGGVNVFWAESKIF